MQFLINYEEYKKYNTPPYAINLLFDKFKDLDKASPKLIEEYAKSHHGAQPSVFSEQYFNRLLANARLNSSRYVDRFDMYSDVTEEWEYEKQQALDNLLNSISTFDLAIANLISELEIDDKDQVAWIYSHKTEAGNLIDFLNLQRTGGNASLGSKDFAKYSIEVMMANPNANPLLGSDCRSFEYAKPPGVLQKACAVKDFRYTFYSAGVTQGGGIVVSEIDSNFPLIYFTMPSWMPNGQAANNTARAITRAVKATDLYYANNPKVSKFVLGDKFIEYIQFSLKFYGGRMT